MIWLVFAVLVLVFTYLGEKRGKSNMYIVSRVLLLVTLSWMTGFGSIAGTDHEAYVDIYHNYVSWDSFSNLNLILNSYIIEPGFSTLNILGNLLGLPDPLFFFVLALLMNTPIVFLLYRFKNPLIAALVFILTINYLQEINLVRQCLAVSIYALSIFVLSQKKYTLHFVLVLLSFTMHTSALICLPLSILGFIDLNKYKRQIELIFFLLWLISILVQLQIVNISSLESMIGSFENTRFEKYADGSRDVGYTMGFNYMFNLLFVFVLLSLRTNVDLYKVLILLGVVLINLNVDALLRFSLYFLIFIPLSCGEYISIENYKKSPSLNSVVNAFKYVFIVYWFAVLFMNYIFGNPLLGSKFYSII